MSDKRNLVGRDECTRRQCQWKEMGCWEEAWPGKQSLMEEHRLQMRNDMSNVVYICNSVLLALSLGEA